MLLYISVQCGAIIVTEPSSCISFGNHEPRIIICPTVERAVLIVSVMIAEEEVSVTVYPVERRYRMCAVCKITVIKHIIACQSIALIGIQHPVIAVQVAVTITVKILSKL